MNDSITKEQVLDAYNNAPDFVRAAFNDEKTTQIVIDLQKKYQLHVDSAGILAKEVGYLLLGLTNPNKFVIRLKNNNFPNQTVSGIVEEINQKIFSPLQEGEKGGGRIQADQTIKPAVFSTVSPSPLPQPMRTSSPSTTPSGSHFHLQNKIPSPLRPMQSSTPVTPYTPSPAATVTPTPNSMPGNKLLEDHEEPHIEFAKVPVVSTPSTPARTAPSPANLPGAIPSGVIPPGGRSSFIVPPKMQYPVPTTPPATKKEIPAIVPQESISPRPPERTQAPPTPSTVPTSATPKAPPPPPPKSYSVDPYREPIE